MKNINEYLSTKVKVDNFDIYEGFPREYDKNIICSFLDNEGFFKAPSKIVKNPNLTMEEIWNYFDIQNKAYMVKDCPDGSFWFRIFKGGEITYQNPLYVLQTKINEGKSSPEYEVYGIETKDGEDFNWKREQFIKEINKHFGWQ